MDEAVADPSAGFISTVFSKVAGDMISNTIGKWRPAINDGCENVDSSGVQNVHVLKISSLDKSLAFLDSFLVEKDSIFSHTDSSKVFLFVEVFHFFSCSTVEIVESILHIILQDLDRHLALPLLAQGKG